MLSLMGEELYKVCVFISPELLTLFLDTKLHYDIYLQ